MKSASAASQSNAPQERSNISRLGEWTSQLIGSLRFPAQYERGVQRAMWAGRLSTALLWICLIIPLAAIACVRLSEALAGPQAIGWVALAIRLFTAGSIVLVVETLIEIRLRAWRSSD